MNFTWRPVTGVTVQMYSSSNVKLSWYSNTNVSTIFGFVGILTQMVLKFLDYLVSQPKFCFSCIKLGTIFGLVIVLKIKLNIEYHHMEQCFY